MTPQSYLADATFEMKHLKVLCYYDQQLALVEKVDVEVTQERYDALPLQVSFLSYTLELKLDYDFLDYPRPRA